MIVYVLYLLSIPSFALFALVGVIVALAGRDGAGPLARSHLDDQVRVWFVAFWWAIGLAVIALVGWITVFIGIGILILWLVAIVGFIVMVWFTVKSFLGLLALLDGRPR
ncbi:putative membrane protein [Terricaulis silvestris]|uniref:Putative membrane protein n=2 Tax=Terricaulis silvestris TaxID=2686094 RepID=A0A6I6MS58_9CAUL|nr:putative membrane protein [Terricaulis silvestris]